MHFASSAIWRPFCPGEDELGTLGMYNRFSNGTPSAFPSYHMISITLFQFSCNFQVAWRLTTWSREVSMAHDRMLQWLYQSEIWQASRQRRCLGVCEISKRLVKFELESRGFETCGKMFYRLKMNRGPGTYTNSVTQPWKTTSADIIKTYKSPMCWSHQPASWDVNFMSYQITITIVQRQADGRRSHIYVYLILWHSGLIYNQSLFSFKLNRIRDQVQHVQ